jgi:putative colanic acid biosynthesis UDP-glucose lipid carrier transferase
VKLTSRGRVLFVQTRHGLNGSHILVFKFRTMNAPGFPADESAPRVTAFGHVLRSTSLDELPQFINVLIGDMSIVGPRPHPLKLNEDFSSKVAGLMARHSVKPGITGLAQISGSRGEIRDTIQMRRRVSYDLHYVRNWSLLYDLRIIAVSMIRGFYNRHP